jgi:hypothetical protein
MDSPVMHISQRLQEPREEHCGTCTLPAFGSRLNWLPMAIWKMNHKQVELIGEVMV